MRRRYHVVLRIVSALANESIRRSMDEGDKGEFTPLAIEPEVDLPPAVDIALNVFMKVAASVDASVAADAVDGVIKVLKKSEGLSLAGQSAQFLDNLIGWLVDLVADSMPDATRASALTALLATVMSNGELDYVLPVLVRALALAVNEPDIPVELTHFLQKLDEAGSDAPLTVVSFDGQNEANNTSAPTKWSYHWDQVRGSVCAVCVVLIGCGL